MEGKHKKGGKRNSFSANNLKTYNLIPQIERNIQISNYDKRLGIIFI